MSATDPAPSRQPTVLARRYRLDRRLAQGGMAEVWVATDLQLSRLVAVKVLKPTLATDPVVAERFRREAVAVARLSHPNIVAVYDAIEDAGRQAVVMQLVEGKSLRQLLDEQRTLSPKLTVHIGTCVAGALDAAHQAGLVHRDVKPGNILITPDGRVLLTDFGIAKGLESDGDDLTSDNIMMGTAKYLSPEQVRGHRLDGRADLYSLGLVLYECLAGRVPFVGQSDADTALARLQRDPTDISRLRPTLPDGLGEVVHRLLARRPNDRFPTGAAARAALNEVNRRADGADTPPSGTASGTSTPGGGAPTDPAVGRSRFARAHAREAGPDPSRGATSGDMRAGTGGVAGALRDRTPRTGRPIPGQPPATLSPPAAGAGRPAVRSATPVPSTSARVDRTPVAAGSPRRRSATVAERRGSRMVVLVAVLAIAAGVVLAWAALRGEPADSGAAPAIDGISGVVDTAAPPPVEVPSPSVPPPPSGSGGAAVDSAAGIAFVATYDPLGDGVENDEQVGFAADGDPTTVWSTVCYESEYLGAKGGVGLVTTFTGTAPGRLEIDLPAGPWAVEVRTVAADTYPASLDGWGEVVAAANANGAETMSVPLIAAARHALVWFRQLPADPDCSGDNPHRASVSEIRFSPNG